MQTVPWRDTSKSSISEIEAENHFFSVSAGEHILESRIKCLMTSDMILVCDGTREARAYIDGGLVCECNGKNYVPASHRSENRAKINLTSGWHDVKILLADGACGELFFGLFKPYGNGWIDEAEYASVI